MFARRAVNTLSKYVNKLDFVLYFLTERLPEVPQRRPRLQVLELQPPAHPVGGRHYGVQQGPRVPHPQVRQEPAPHLRVLHDSHGQAAPGPR